MQSEIQEIEQEMDMVDELMRNERNRKILFDVKFPKQIKKQSDLKLNKICDSEKKKLILDFFKSDEVFNKIKEKIESDPLLS